MLGWHNGMVDGEIKNALKSHFMSNVRPNYWFDVGTLHLGTEWSDRRFQTALNLILRTTRAIMRKTLA